ncbi:MAG: hypothetical protein R3Y56_09935, partial [Akkermansia sp.]
MAIHLKDWGMVPTPAKQPSWHSSGINALENARQDLAKGISDFGKGLGSFSHEKEEIKKTGYFAKISQEVSELNKEVHEEVSAQGTDNWDYSWNKASQSRIKALIDELPESSREMGSKVAHALNQRASVKARSEAEIAQIQESQQQWSQQLQLSEQQGDEQQCELWLSAGRGTFFAEDELESKLQECQERCRFNRWQGKLDQEPLATLAALEEDDAEIQGIKDAKLRQQWERKLQSVRSGTRSELGELFVSHLREGAELSEEQLDLAHRAKLLSPQQFEQARQAKKEASHPEELCRWRRTIDEFDTRDDESFTQLKLDLGTAALPLREKQNLLTRLEKMQGITLSDRRSLSRQIWSYYNSGLLGARQDRSCLKRLQGLLDEGMEHMLEAGA